MNRILKSVINYEKGRGGRKPLLIVLHTVGLPGITAESAYQHFNNPASEVSAHAVVLRNGDIWEFVSDFDTSWGAGTVGYKNGVPIPPTNPVAKTHWQQGVRLNQIALNLEHEGDEYSDLTEAQYKSSGEWVKEKCVKFNIPINNIHICGHRDIKATKVCPGKISVKRIIDLANAPVSIPVAPLVKMPKVAPSWMSNFLWRAKLQFGAIFGNRTLGAIRSSDWSKLQKETVKEHPYCAFHGGKGTILNPLNVHHIEPFHIKPELELVKSNLIVACRFCHLWYCHLGSWRSYNIHAREDAALLISRIQNRP